MKPFDDFLKNNQDYLADKPTIKWLFENVAQNLRKYYNDDYDLKDHCEELSGMKGWVVFLEEVLITDIDGGFYFCVAYDFFKNGSIQVTGIKLRGGDKK